MAPPPRPVSEEQIQERAERLWGLEAAHRLVSIVFYGLIAATVVQFLTRLGLDRGKLEDGLLKRTRSQHVLARAL